jgi:hypothetical protein
MIARASSSSSARKANTAFPLIMATYVFIVNSGSAWGHGHRKFDGLLQLIQRSRSQLAVGADNARIAAFRAAWRSCFLCVRDETCVAKKMAGGLGLAARRFSRLCGTDLAKRSGSTL